jgi:hypothetical protein
MSDDVYVASSWRNKRQPEVVAALRAAGLSVYDFRNPAEGDHGFHWSEIDKDWQQWTPEQYLDGLEHNLAKSGFCKDFDALCNAKACALVLPCGRSAHLEFGYALGQGKPGAILLCSGEPELMNMMADFLTPDLDKLVKWSARQIDWVKNVDAVVHGRPLLPCPTCGSAKPCECWR